MRAIYPGEIPGNYSAAISSDQMIEEETRTYGESGWQQTKSVLDDLTSHHGGMFRVRQGIDGRMYLDWLKHYFENEVSNQVIEVGKNIIDASSATEVNNIFTVVVPIGQGSEKKGNLYIDGMYFPVSKVTEFYTDEELRSGYHLPEDYRNAYAQYGTIIKPIELQECATKEVLLSECAKWVKENYFGGIEEISVTAVDFHQIGKNGNDVKKIICGGRYVVRFPVGNGVIKERTLTCTAATLDLYNPENNQYTFGIPASSLKGYSVNSKKSKQDADNTEPEKFGSGGGGLTDYQKWYKEKFKWLRSHRVWWKHLSPEDRKHYQNVGNGPNGPNMDSCFIHDINILDADGDKQAEVWVPTLINRRNVGTDSDPKWVYNWRLNLSTLKPVGTWKRIKRKLLDQYAYDLKKDYLMEYVYDEWNGTDLSLGMPLSTTDLDGIIEEITGEPGVFTYDGESFLNIGERIKAVFSDPIASLRDYFPQADAIITNIEKVAGKLGLGSVVEAGKTFINSLGQSVTSFITNNDGITAITTMLQDSFGNLSFTNATVDGLTGNLKTDGDMSFEDASGHPVSLRKMEIDFIESDNKRGVITKKFFDPVGDDNPEDYVIIPYEFTQSIENYLGGGDIIVARVEGDEVLIGNGKASEVVNRALHHVTDVVGDVELATDAQGHKYWKIKTGGGLHIEKNGVELGVWDEGNLTGGVMVKKINFTGLDPWEAQKYYKKDDKVTHEGNSYSCKVDHKSGDTFDSSKWKGYYISETNISGDVIKIEAKTGVSVSVSDKIGEHDEEIEGVSTKVETFEGSELWQDRDNITGVCGEYDVITDPATGKKTLIIKAGGGIKIRRDSSEFGIYDEYNLTGGIITAKVNNETETYIVGDRIQVGDKTGVFYSGYISDDHNNFYSDKEKTIRIVGQTGKFYGDIPSDKVYTWNGTTFVETSKTLDLQTSSMKGIVATKATVTELNAVRARVGTIESNYVKASEITADKLAAKLATVSKLSVMALDVGGALRVIGAQSNPISVTFGDYVSSYFTYPNTYKEDGNTIDMRKSFCDVSASTSGNNVTLTFTTLYGSDLQKKSVTFRKASLLKGSWSGGIFTVSEDPNGTLAPIATTALKIENVANTISRSGKNITQHCKVRWFDASLRPYTDNPYQDTGFESDVTIDATSVWNAARADYKLKGTWSGGIFTVSEDSSGTNAPVASTSLKLEKTGDASRSGKTVSQTVKVRWFDSSLTPYTENPYQDTGFEQSVSIDATSVWNAARADYKLKGTWSGGIFTVSEDSSGTNAPVASTSLKLEKTGDASRSGKTVSQTVKVRWFDSSLTPYTENPYQDTGFEQSVSIDATSVWNDGNTSGWNDGYDNASGQVKVDGIPTVNTDQHIVPGNYKNITVPANVSGSRTTLTFKFTADNVSFVADRAIGDVDFDDPNRGSTSSPISTALIKARSGSTDCNTTYIGLNRGAWTGGRCAINVYLNASETTPNDGTRIIRRWIDAPGVSITRVVQTGNKYTVYGKVGNSEERQLGVV